MRRDRLVELRRLDRSGEALAHRTHRLAVLLDNRIGRNAEALPAAQMREKTIGQTRRRLAFLGLPGPFGAAMEHAALDVDIAAADRRMERRAGGMPATNFERPTDKEVARLFDIVSTAHAEMASQTSLVEFGRGLRWRRLPLPARRALDQTLLLLAPRQRERKYRAVHWR